MSDTNYSENPKSLRKMDSPTNTQSHSSTLIQVSLCGPFGCKLFNMNRLDGLACFVAGVGITGVSQLLFDCMELYPEKRLYILWSIRDSDKLELSLFKGKLYITEELIAAKNLNTIIKVNITNMSNSIKESTNFNCDLGRIDISRELSNIMDEIPENQTIGVYSCAPEDYIINVENACRDYPGRIIFEREIFTY